MKNNGSMNRIFRLVWNQSSATWVAVAETTRGPGKGANRKLVAAAALSLSLTLGLAHAGPVGGQVVTGTGSISQAGSTTTITQTSSQLSLNWQNFNIGAAETVNFVQPSAAAIAVNRIQGVGASQIFGHLNANGQVYLINPNGVLFGQGALVNVGALVASTLDLNGANASASTRSFSGEGLGSIVNQGVINAAEGGFVALLGRTVSNQGSISAPLGTVALGAGSDITLTFNANSLVKMQINQSLLDSLADNGGLIKADGGRVLMSAGANDALLASVVNNTGVIEAHSVENHGGVITLLGGMTAGSVRVGGTLDASASNPVGSVIVDGGFIETSAAHVKVADGAKITTLAANGKAGTWLIDPTDFTVTAGSALQTDSGIGAATLTANLAGGNVAIATSATVTGSEKGDINVNAALTWTAHTLTLTAHNDININAVLSVNDAASLDLQPASGKVNVGFNTDGSFKGRVDFFQAGGVTPRVGTGFLTIGANGYTVIAPTAAGLALLAAPGNYALGSNINLASAAFTPIGAFNSSVFDGLGHTISNLLITGGANTGLFATTLDATIRNVGLVGGSVIAGAGSGALVGNMTSSTISNSFAQNVTVTGGAGTGGLVGSIVGIGNSSISNSYTTGAVVGNAGTGGLVGSLAGTGVHSISNSHATGNVNGLGGAGVGGLVGSVASTGLGCTNINNSYATGMVDGAAATGGLVGSMAGVVGSLAANRSNISNSYATGAVSSHDAGGAGTGGLVGSLADVGNISNSYATGNVRSTGAATGGLVGSAADSGTISNSCAAGDVLGDGAGTGGLVGSSANTVAINAVLRTAAGDITSSYATGSVQSVAAGTGGLVGSNTGGAISKSFAAATVNGGGAGTGGLVGSNTAGTISESFAVGNVSGSGRSIAEIIANSAVTVGASTGGLVGSNHGAILNSYAAGNVEGFAAGVGGLVGHNLGTVTNSYVAGHVTGQTGASGVGALVGLITGGGTDSNAFHLENNVTLNGSAAAAITPAGTSVSSVDLGAFTAATSTAAAGWDFATVWKMPTAGSAYAYPVLQGPQKTFTLTDVVKTYDGLGYLGTAILSSTSCFCPLNPAVATLRSSPLTAAVNVGVYAMTPVLTTVNPALASYFNIAASSGTLSITPAPLTLSGVTASDKVYTATTDAVLGGSGVLSGLVGTETLNLSGQFDNKNVGANKAVTVVLGNGTTSGLASNYALTQPTGLTASISKADLVVSGLIANNKVYDAGTAATLAGTSAVAKLGTDDITLSGVASGAFASKTAATGKAVTVTGNTLTGNDAVNYTLIQQAGLTADISRADLFVTGLTASNKVYNANTTATLAGTAAVNKLGTDDITLGGVAVGAFASKAAATGTAVTVTGKTLSGGDAGNYNLIQQTGLTADISKADLVVSGLIANNKVYNADAVATLTGTAAVAKLGTDDITLSGVASGAFASKTAATGKAVTVTGNTLGGADAGNYNLIQQTGLTADISKADLVVSGLIANNKVYDAGTAATLAGTAVVAKLGTDDITLSGAATGSFASKTAATGKAVTVTGNTLTGNDAVNYTLSQQAGLTADISKADLFVTGLTASNKVYNANTTAMLAGTAAVNKLGTDDITLSGAATGAFASKAAATGKAVAVTGNTLSGTDAGNYTLIQQTGLTADISQADLVLTGLTASNKVYDGTTAVALTGGSLLGLLGSDAALVNLNQRGSFASSNAGNAVAVATTASLSGEGAGNYRLLQPTSGLTANISQAVLTVSGVSAASKVFDANTAATLSGNTAIGASNGLVNGETLSLSGRFESSDAASSKVVILSGVALAGDTGLASNYRVIQPTGSSAVTANITAAASVIPVTPVTPVTPVVPTVPVAAAPEVVQQTVQNVTAQIQSGAVLVRPGIQPGSLDLSPTITVTRSASIEAASQSSAASNVGGASTTDEAALAKSTTGIATNTRVNINGTGPSLLIVSTGIRMPEELANPPK